MKLSEASQSIVDGELGYLYVQQPDLPMSALTDYEIEMLDRSSSTITDSLPSASATLSQNVTPDKTECHGLQGNPDSTPHDVACTPTDSDTVLISIGPMDQSC